MSDRPEPALADLLAAIGDNKYFLGRWLSQWAVGAPGLESAVAAAAIAQGSLGQARALLPFVDQPAGGNARLGAPDQAHGHHIAALDAPFDTWAQAVVTLYLVDPGLDVVLRALGATPSEELARRVARVLDESRFHAGFARGRLVELVTRWPAGPAQVATHLRPVLTEMLCWFGPAGEPGVEALRAGGLLEVGNAGMRQRYLDAVAPTLLQHGYDIGVARARDGWTYEDLPWDRWNRQRRRLEAPQVTCPWCGSGDVSEIAPYASVPMTAQWFCDACGSPFERIRHEQPPATSSPDAGPRET